MTSAPKLRPFQRIGVDTLLERDAQGIKGQLLADDMGLGKTVQAIAFADAVNASPILVVCPACLVDNWGAEVEKWAREPESWVIRSYNIATRDWQEYAGRNRWGLLVLDECHNLKSESSNRTRMIAGGIRQGRPPHTKGWKQGPLLRSAARSLWVSGTPILNRPSELIPMLAAIGALESDFGGRERFSRYHCQGHHEGREWVESGAAHLEELGRKLSPWMLRRTKDEVLTELPPKIRTIIPLGSKKLTGEEEERMLTAELFGLEEAMRNMYPPGCDFESMSLLRSEEAQELVNPVVSYCREVLCTTTPIIVFAHHVPLVQGIAEGLRGHGYRTAVIAGGISKAKRAAAVESFQGGELDVVVCSIRAAGVGITLTRASTVISAEADWSPGINWQAEDRAHRIGQKGTVICHYLVREGSLASLVLRKMLSKQEVIDGVFNTP